MSNSTESIIAELQKMAKEKGVLEPEILLTAAEKLAILLQNETDVLADKEYDLAVSRKVLLDAGKTSSETRMQIEASPLYLEARKLRNKIDMVKQFILLCKKHATLASDMLRNI